MAVMPMQGAMKKKPGGPPRTLTQEWIGADGRDIRKGDRVRSKDGLEGVVTGRWTKLLVSGPPVPMVSGLIPNDGMDIQGKPARRVARPVAECRHAAVRDDDEVSL
jgi:hypothetical protein